MKDLVTLGEARAVAEGLEAETFNQLLAANDNHPPRTRHLHDKSPLRREQHPVVAVLLLLRLHLTRRTLGSMKDLVTLGEAQVVAEGLEAETLDRLLAAANDNHPPLLHRHLRDKNPLRREQHPVVAVLLLHLRHLAKTLGHMMDLGSGGECVVVVDDLKIDRLLLAQTAVVVGYGRVGRYTRISNVLLC
jgi:hypothetical protein